MRAAGLLGCLLLGLPNVSAWEVELKELVNPSLVKFSDSSPSGLDLTCAPNGCIGVLTRDGSQNVDSRFGCTQQEDQRFTNACTVKYRLNEEPYSGGTPQTISSVHVAFTADSETTLQVLVQGESVVESWTGETGVTELQEIPGLTGYSADELELVAVMSKGSYIGITETEIYVEVDDVPVTGISASERVSVTTSATVNSDAAMDTLDGSTSLASSWSCSEGDVCEITYDLQEVQSTEQVRIAFGDEASMAGATFNVYTAGTDGVFTSVLSGVTAGPRDLSLEGLQTFGAVRKLARYVQIEGVPASGGEFSISEVDIRVNKDAPIYPTTVDSSLVPLGRLPLGGDHGSNTGVPYDRRPAGEGGCSAGHLEGCHVYNIKDGENTPESRWSCSPSVEHRLGGVCDAEYDLNTHRYLRQIQLAFHKGDERHNEFSIHVRTEGGWVEAVPSAISSGDTTDYQTWDISAWTNAIQLRPKFGSVGEWISIKEMVLLEQKQGSRSTPVLSFDNSEAGFTFVESEGRIHVGGSGQTARIWAVKMKFAPNKSFTFDIRYFVDDETEVSTRFTSAGGNRRWERFVLPERVVLDNFRIVAIEGPDIEDYPTLRVSDCQVLGKPYSPGSTWVVSTTIEEWDVVPDYISDGSGDQEEIMQAICDGIGEGFDGTDCDGVATGNDETPEVNLKMGDYYMDGPVFLKTGIHLNGRWSEDDSPFETRFRMHGSGTGADGVINADGVSDAFVDSIHVISNLESAGPAGTVGNVCLDVESSQDITIDLMAWTDCPMASTRFVDSEGIIGNEFYVGEPVEGPELLLESVTDFILTESRLEGVTIKDSSNILFEGGLDDGDFFGSIDVPKGGDQSANLVVSGTTSGVTLKDISVGSGAEPRIVLENSNPFTIDGVTISGGTAGDCIIQFPQTSDGDVVLIQLNVETQLLLEGDCFELA